MLLEFRPGIMTSSPASRDPYAQYCLWRGLIPAITHSSTPSLIDHNISCRHNPKPTTAELNTKCRPTPAPISIHYFTGRPLITHDKCMESQRKTLRRKFRYLHKPISISTPNPCIRQSSRPRKLKCEYDTAPKLRPHIGPLTPHGNFFSIDNPL
jgi:hypothetical protein